MRERVLVTGVSGFLGGHIALQLLKAGYRVRGSVRSKAQCELVWTALRTAGADPSNLEFVELNLLSDTGWKQAAEGCDFLQHVASPFVLSMPKDRDELIRPAVEGTRRAIQAALSVGMRRIVLTSSMAAIDHGHKDNSRVFTERDWTDLSGANINAYVESKTLAERKAWQIVEEAGQRNKLVVINPAAMLGPLLDDDPGTTGSVIVRLLSGGMPAAPRIILEYVDVRDVAAVHVAAMENPAAAGCRMIVSEEALSLMQIADILREKFPDFAGKLPRREMPDWLVTVLSYFDKSLRDSAAFVGIRKESDASGAERLLGRTLTSARVSVVETARSAIERKLV